MTAHVLTGSDTRFVLEHACEMMRVVEAEHVRRCVCPAGRERTFEGVPIYGGGGRRYNFYSEYAKMEAKK